MNANELRFGESLTGAHLVVLMLELSTPVGLECNEVGGAELHMISMGKGMQSKKEKGGYNAIFFAFFIFLFFLFFSSKRHYLLVGFF
jgi:hypothetical protein